MEPKLARHGLHVLRSSTQKPPGSVAGALLWQRSPSAPQCHNDTTVITPSPEEPQGQLQLPSSRLGTRPPVGSIEKPRVGDAAACRVQSPPHTWCHGSSQSRRLAATHSSCWETPAERRHRWLVRTPGHCGPHTRAETGLRMGSPGGVAHSPMAPSVRNHTTQEGNPRRMGCENKSGSMWGCDGAVCQPKTDHGSWCEEHPPWLQRSGRAQGEHIHACEVLLKKSVVCILL